MWPAGNAQQKTDPPILMVRNPEQTMRALRRASLCIAVEAVIYQKRQELAELSPGEFLVLANTSIWWASVDFPPP